ncbi:hypothetical protein K449DRAFT_379994 [Hypoxylon sp. EC38]|nr:hypothetical protein K449DRAFT_379994 [Hypoxylon sp. EC38]
MRFSAFFTALVFSASTIFAIAVPEIENVAGKIAKALLPDCYSFQNVLRPKLNCRHP